MTDVESVSDLALVTTSASSRPEVSSSALMAKYRRIIIGSDLLAAIIAALVAMTVRFGLRPSWVYVVASALFPLLWLAGVTAQRGYETRFLGAGPEEFRRLTDATLWTFVCSAALFFVIKSDVSRAYVMIVLPLALFLSVMGRRWWRKWLFTRRLAGHGLHRVLAVGRADAVAHLDDQFRREPWHGLEVVGACVPDIPGHDLRVVPARLPIVGDVDDILQAVDEMGVDTVAVVSHPDLSGTTLRRLGWALDERGVDLVVSPGIVEVAGPRLSIRPISGLSLLHLEHPNLQGGRLMIKAALDKVLSILLLILASPLLLATVVAIKVTSPGPALFRQRRIGVDGKEFQILKFRSMVVDAEARKRELLDLNENDAVLFKIRNDPRITPVGALIRRFSIDELPQLWNVVRGEMSLVGPRPPLPDEVEAYDFDAVRRLRVKPGLTGLWQVSGRSDLSWEEAIRLDLRYVDNWTLWMDVAILWRTGRAVLRRDGAY